MRAAIALVALTCIFCAGTFAEISEDSASLSALSGVTALAVNPSDRILSPVALIDGSSFSYHLPFGDADTALWGFHNGNNLWLGHTGFGVSWMAHPHYTWRDHYLSYAIGIRDFALGYTQHLIYEGFSTGEAYYNWEGDLGLIANYSDYGMEIRWLRMASRDAQWHFTAITNLSDNSNIATDYVYVPHGTCSFRTAAKVGLSEMLTLMSSWKNEPASFGFGIRMGLSASSITYAIHTHPELNLSHSLEICYLW